MRVFQQPHYAKNFVQSVLDVLNGFAGQALVSGGDGRFLDREVIQAAVRMVAANGYDRVMVDLGGILSTPAASNVNRKYQAFGGLNLSTSHNFGGRDKDFGVKYNISNGGPAPGNITEAIYASTKVIDRYLTVDAPDKALDQAGDTLVAGMTVTVIDPVTDNAELIEQLSGFLPSAT